MNECICSRTTDNYLCKTCTGNLATKLASVPALFRDLDITIGRRDKVTPIAPRVATGETNRMPINISASDVKGGLIDAIQGVHIATKPVRVQYFADPIKLAHTVRLSLDKLPLNPKAGAIHETFMDAYGKATEAIDLPPEMIRLGTCGAEVEGEVCEEELVVPKGDPWVHCKTCGSTWDVAEHKQQSVNDAGNVEAYPSVIVKALTKAGYSLTDKQFNKWIENKQITAQDTDDTGRRLYRVKDVIALASGATTNTTRRAG